MYKTLTDLDLTPSQREMLDFLIKQAGRYEFIRVLAGFDGCSIFDELNEPLEFDRKIDEMIQIDERIQNNKAKERLKKIDDSRKFDIDAL